MITTGDVVRCKGGRRAEYCEMPPIRPGGLRRGEDDAEPSTRSRLGLE